MRIRIQLPKLMGIRICIPALKTHWIVFNIPYIFLYMRVWGRWVCGALSWVRRWRRRKGEDPDPYL
jgi:hypothetical protein